MTDCKYTATNGLPCTCPDYRALRWGPLRWVLEQLDIVYRHRPLSNGQAFLRVALLFAAAILIGLTMHWGQG